MINPAVFSRFTIKTFLQQVTMSGSNINVHSIRQTRFVSIQLYLKLFLTFSNLKLCVIILTMNTEGSESF